MKLPEKILRPVKHIFGGAAIDHKKNTADYETVKLPTPKTVCIPMSQHIGAPAEPCVKKGDTVYVGTVVGTACGFVSSPVHSSVSGTVTDVSEKVHAGRKVTCVTIESDGKNTEDPNLSPKNIKTMEELIEATKDCGLVGLGGAGFPTHVKLTPPKNGKIDTLVINAAECEPYITTDYRAIMERYTDVMDGIYTVKDLLGIENVVICVEKNKPEAIIKLYNIATDNRDKFDHVKLMVLPDKYPQGAEKVIVYSATGRKIPAGGLPSDVGCIVMNVTSILMLFRYIRKGMPLIAKRITIDGTAVSEPKNILVPIGTKIRDVIDFVGGIDENADRVILGGPMMGQPVYDIDDVIDKRNNAILIMKSEKPQPVTACIRCGRCATACPMSLYPQKVESVYNAGLLDEIKNLNVDCCMECGSCAYVCPAKRPLTEVMRISKQILRGKK